MSPSTMLRAGREGRQKADTLNIPRTWTKSNAPESPLLFYERFLLCHLMVSGSPVRYQYFTDPRNRLIYEYLSWLQTQEYRPGVNSLVRYLNECGILKRAGGEAYVMSVFRGIPEGDSA